VASVKTAVTVVAGRDAAAGGCGVLPARSFQAKDVARWVTRTDPRICPDGREIAAAPSRPNVKSKLLDPQIHPVDGASRAVHPPMRYHKGVHTRRGSRMVIGARSSHSRAEAKVSQMRNCYEWHHARRDSEVTMHVMPRRVGGMRLCLK
jgi:hypothetical protein